ncbi:MAG: hypothetical protein ACRDP6_16510 [Actinoallomurus sp.]
MTRAAVRQGIAAYFGGNTYDAVYRIWRPTPLAANGLAGVRQFFPKRFSKDDYTFGYSPPRAMGGVMVVHIPLETEKRIALGGPTAGIKRLTYSVELWLYHQGQTPHAEDPQADFDGLIEAVVARIRADRTLGGIVTEAGEGPNTGITKTASEPVRNNETTEQYGVIRFDANAYPSA